MTDGVFVARRFVMMACVSVALLAAAGCSSPEPNEEGGAGPETVALKSVKVELVADVSRATPGETFHVGALYTIPKRSHIYWRNPGASGLPTGVEWTLPEWVEVGELLWPVPKRFEIEGWDEVSFGYESEVLLLTEVRVPDGKSDMQSISIMARVYWLNCEEDGQCIPGDAELQLEIPVGAGPESSSYAPMFERYRQRVPVPLDLGNAPFSIEREAGASFMVRPYADARIDFDGQGDAPDFFPDEGEAWTFERIPGAELGSAESVRFTPPVGGTVASGVLKVSVHREDSSARQVFYISMSE